MPQHNRRVFLRRVVSGGLAATALALPSTRAFGRVLGANDRVRIAVVGVNGRGLAHVEMISKVPNTEIAYLVDVDSRMFESRAKKAEELTGNRPQCVQDMRKVLEDKDIDVVSIATPNHWHALQAIWACQAGKDVYVEKPCSHNIFEGRKLVEAARKYNRIVQHGTQSRSDAAAAKYVAAAKSGKYGKLLVAYGYASKPRPSIKFKEPGIPPKELDFDIWLGPALQQPYHGNIVPYNWHWFWDFGNGEIGNQGVHQMDIARWAMPEGSTPRSVISLGGRFGYSDQGQTPNTQLTVFDYGETKIIFEDRGLVDEKAMRVTNEFLTEEGTIRNGQFFPNGKTEGQPLEGIESKVQPGGPYGNFIDCVRSRKQEELNAEIAIGHQSAALCHLGNISYRLGSQTPFSDEAKSLGDDKHVRESFESMKTHLADAAKLDPANATYCLGRRLEYDGKAERFVGDVDADKLLTRPYRAPYVVPETV